ncbi:MAG TPA: amino acid adenylation domain-containing protein [Thermoanaerobaculia bacterium]|nr:amino acid adenylation domain-containing protein [Thermoanaerobaculia bacterium]
MSEAIHRIFERTADRRGDRVAIESDGRSVTYRELKERANGLATALLALGAQPGSLVALLASCTEDAAAAMLGTLQAGCAFVPLDRRSPAVRLESVVAEVKPRWWMASPDLGDLADSLRREAGGAEEVIPLGEDGPRSDRPPAVPEPDPESLCYVFFTSGSTGRPKGIAGRLKAIDHFIRWEIETFGLDQSCRVSQLTSPAFDAVLRDIFVPLAAGGTLVAPASPETVLDGARLVDWIDRERLTLVHCTPTVFRSLLRQDLTPGHFPALRHVLLAGEPLLPADVRRWSAVFGERIELVNLYGASETTMTKVFYRVRPGDGELRVIPAGQPMPGARVIVLDEKRAPCPPGQVGEIVLRTPYRSLGYLNQPELTASVFIQNPFSQRPDDLIYLTGDLGRLREDGLLEVLGRRDQQVKVRGIRVEIAPIEEALRSHPAVLDAAVVDHSDAQGDKLLCAYLVLRGEPDAPGAPDAGSLREYLAERLPEAMVPSAFLRLPALPRTLTGKLDRGALPAPGEMAERLSSEKVAPRTPLEERLAALAGEVLGVPDIGIRENFFALGGHSLLAAQLLARIRLELGVEIPLGQVFHAATVEALAAEVSLLQAARRATDEIPRQPEADSYPLSFAQERLWRTRAVEAGSPINNVASAVRLGGPLRVPILEQALSEAVRRHETLRTVFVSDRGEPRQIVKPPAPVTLPVADLSGLPDNLREEEARRLAVDALFGAFDLARPLLRCALLKLAWDDHVMVYAVHRIVADFWSVGLLMGEVGMGYLARLRGRLPMLPELPIQYRDFAAWQRDSLQNTALQERLAWWRSRLAGAPAFLRLPTDRPRPAVQSFRGAHEIWEIPAGAVEPLHALSVAEGGGLFPVFLTAFQILLGAWAQQEDFVVASPVGFRSRRETENLVGPFANTLLLRADLTGDPPLRGLLARSRGQVVESYTRSDVPLDLVIEEPATGRVPGANPFLQVALNFQDSPLEANEGTGLKATPLHLDAELSPYELNLILVRTTHSFRASLRYRSDLFTRGTVTAMVHDLGVILEWLAARPEETLSSLQEALSQNEVAKDLSIPGI